MDLSWSEPLQLCSYEVCRGERNVQGFQGLEEGESPKREELRGAFGRREGKAIAVGQGEHAGLGEG